MSRFSANFKTAKASTYDLLAIALFFAPMVAALVFIGLASLFPICEDVGTVGLCIFAANP